jgi:hypothetical protein
MSMNSNWLSLSILTMISFTGCTSDKDTSLSYEEKKYVDSLYQIQLSKIKVEQDSICNIHRDTIYKYALDSIYETRVKEVEELMKY